VPGAIAKEREGREKEERGERERERKKEREGERGGRQLSIFC